MLKNNKGFTLLEVLAVGVLLALLIGGAIAAYSSYITKSKTNYYKKQEDLVTQAGRDFFIDNKGKLPQSQGEERCVTLGALINRAYIKEVKDYNKKSCNPDESKVCAVKLEKNKYIYYSKLICGNTYQTAEYAKPKITMNPANGERKNATPNHSYKITMNIGYASSVSEDKKSPIASYRYVIYRKDKDNQIYYDSGWKGVSTGKTTHKVEVELETNGEYFIKGWTYNEKGKQAEETSGSVILSYDLVCGRDIKFINNNYTLNSWTNKDIKTTIKASGGVSKYTLTVKKDDSVVETINDLKPIYYNYTLNNEGTYSYEITAYSEDNRSCTISSSAYKIDKTPPTCNVTSDKTGLTNQNVVLTATCTETNGSGCKQNTLTETITEEMNKKYLFRKVFDNAGNEALCNEVDINIDKTGPKLVVTATRCTNASSGETCNTSLNSSTKQTKTTTSNAKIDFSSNDTVYSTDGAHIEYSVEDDNFDYNTEVYNAAGTYSTLTGLTENTSQRYPATGILNINQGGKRVARITAYDKAGNSSYVDVRINVSKKYTLTYSGGGSTCTTKTVEKKSDTATWGDLCNPSYTGYTFDGWYTAASGGNKVTSSTKVTGNLTVYPHKTPVKVVVTYKANGGTGSDKTQTYTYGASGQNLINQGYTKSYYTQDGWSLTAGGDKKYGITASVIDSWIVSNSPSITLYAHWKPNVCTIKFDPNGGTFTSNASNTTQTLEYNNSVSDMWNANGGYYSAKLSGKKPSPGKEWINGSTTYDQSKGYSITQLCPSIASGNQTVTLKVNWINDSPITKFNTAIGNKYCTLHNQIATGAGGSTTKSCTEEITGSNCRSSYNWTGLPNGCIPDVSCYGRGSDTYANMTILSFNESVSGTTLTLKLKIRFWAGCSWTSQSRTICLSENSRKFSTSECTYSAGSFSLQTSDNYCGQNTVAKDIDNIIFTIPNYTSKSGKSYSLITYGSYGVKSCPTSANNYNTIFTFQTDYLFKIN